MFRLKKEMYSQEKLKPYTFLGNCTYDGTFNFEYKKLNIPEFFPEKKHFSTAGSSNHVFDFVANDLGFLHLPRRKICHIYDEKCSKTLNIKDHVRTVKNLNNFYLIFGNRVIEITKGYEQLIFNNSYSQIADTLVENNHKTNSYYIKGLVDLNYTVTGETCLLYPRKLFFSHKEKYFFDSDVIQFHPTSHPREFFVLSLQDVFFVDLRMPDPIHIHHDKAYIIDSKISSCGKLYVLDQETACLIDRRNNRKQTVAHKLQGARLSLNDKEVILHTGSAEFLFLDKQNLFHNRKIIFDIPDFTAFTTRKNEYHFLTSTGIYSFKNGSKKYLKVQQSQKRTEYEDIDLDNLGVAYSLYKKRIKRRDEEEICIPKYFTKLRFAGKMGEKYKKMAE